MSPTSNQNIASQDLGRPIVPFRIHFDDLSVPPLDVKAVDADEARKLARACEPKTPITKIKIVREAI